MSDNRKMKSQILDAMNTLDVARYLNNALHMAVASRDVHIDVTNALQAITDGIANKLQSVHDQLLEIMEDCTPVDKSNSGEN